MEWKKKKARLILGVLGIDRVRFCEALCVAGKERHKF